MAGRKKKNYLNNSALMEQIKLSKEQKIRMHNMNPDATPAECMTDELIKQIMMLVDNYGSKGNWRGYTWNDDMRSEAMISLLNGTLKFNPDVSQNPFGYLTQIVTHSFLTTLDKEKKVRTIRDDILEQHGFTPSHTRQLENEAFAIEKREAELCGNVSGGDMIDEGTVYFSSRLECWNPMTKVATVTAEIEKKDPPKKKPGRRRKQPRRRIPCRIPFPVLQELYCATESDPMAAIVSNREVVRRTALRLLTEEIFQEDGTILISAEDLTETALRLIEERCEEVGEPEKPKKTKKKTTKKKSAKKTAKKVVKKKK